MVRVKGSKNTVVLPWLSSKIMWLWPCESSVYGSICCNKVQIVALNVILEKYMLLLTVSFCLAWRVNSVL